MPEPFPSRPTKPELRRAKMLDMIEQAGRASVEELADRFSASLETVRRDLGALAESGAVRKVHGGAVRVEWRGEDSFEDRLAANVGAKREIAKKFARIVTPGQCIMMDTGSTTLACAQALTGIPNLTVVTNSTRIADAVARADNGSRAQLVGGTYRPENAQTVGPQTCSELLRYRPDITVLTIHGVDNDGCYDFSEDEAQVARAMVSVARKVVLVCDASKLERTSTYLVCGLDRVSHVVTNQLPRDRLRSTFEAAGIALL
ncbi:DeoR/GlpR family DNA-binding transcription regulator [Salipiger mangrovisoli]|uniref:DeoR/GlpR transcriptional regulator n=1 Tax=Salipiger mangrovisoli TaxID=2865933 RepID=A0ABR9X5Q1_9RHOB|nr:DeoR/GlpR family DNA-binding transcription regulator [Salipiger mangrovisoli]MBE9638849.1 DeoR/GlpR transcriptional regulator [Salipiger mangrovisoli]